LLRKERIKSTGSFLFLQFLGNQTERKIRGGDREGYRFRSSADLGERNFLLVLQRTGECLVLW